MEIDDDFLLSSSPLGASPSPVRHKKLKRLKKAIRVSSDDDLERPKIKAKSSDLEARGIEDSEEPLPFGSGLDEFNGRNALVSGFSSLIGDEDGSGAKRALDFDSLTGDEDGSEAKKALDFDSFSVEFGEMREEDSKEAEEEIGDVRLEGLDDDLPSPDRLIVDKEDKKEKMNKKRKERIDGDGDGAKKINEKPLTKRRFEKERQENLKQLFAESQRLLRETRDASFKPVPLVRKPISSVLEKIRLRKLEISKKFVSNSKLSSGNEDDNSSREVSVNPNTESDIRVIKASNAETPTSPIVNDSQTHSPCKDEKSPQMVVDEESRQAFRAPNDDTQDLFSDSQTSDSKNETPSSPLEEAFAPSEIPLNLQLDSAPPDDVSSDEEEEYDKENIDPCPRGSADLSLSPTGNPVKAFVDDEAEEEDDSDNDLLRFKEYEENDDDSDLEELRNMIATGYEEKPSDNEKRNELHQKWLEQQDADGTENLLQKLKKGSKVKRPALIEDDDEEEDQGGEEDGESEGEGGEDLAPSSLVKMNLRKAKETMPQMFTDTDEEYLSSDDEETEEKLTRQYLLEKAKRKEAFLSQDDSSREVLGRIKKLNIVPDNKKRPKAQTYFDMSLVGLNKSISSKPSFLSRGSGASTLPVKKQGSTAVRSFIFEREDSNSRNAISVSVESSETVQVENKRKTISAKFISSQTRTLTQNPESLENPETSLIDILKRNSFASKRCALNDVVPQTESILASFKLAKKAVKPREDRSF